MGYYMYVYLHLGYDQYTLVYYYKHCKIHTQTHTVCFYTNLDTTVVTVQALSV